MSLVGIDFDYNICFHLDMQCIVLLVRTDTQTILTQVL